MYNVKFGNISGLDQAVDLHWKLLFAFTRESIIMPVKVAISFFFFFFFRLRLSRVVAQTSRGKAKTFKKVKLR